MLSNLPVRTDATRENRMLPSQKANPCRETARILDLNIKLGSLLGEYATRE